MNDLRIFAAEAITDVGRQYGVVIARDIHEAYSLFQDSYEFADVTTDDIDLIEIPMEVGYTYIGGSCEE